MANSIFLDTSGWLAILNANEHAHAQAVGIWSEIVLTKRFITLTDWVVAEAGNGLARSQKKFRLSESLHRLLQSPRTDLVNIDQSLLDRALDFYTRHADKSWGLVDCASFLVMQDRGIGDAFTSDRHFEQAGFRCLL